jgi:MFS family permease
MPGRRAGRARAARAAKAVGRGIASTGRVTARGSRASARFVGRGTKAGTAKFRAFAQADGADQSGLARLVELHAVGSAADAAFTISLASTVLALPTGQARGQVAVFLLTTMAPFVLLSPLIGPLLDRYRHGRRWAIGATLALRAFLSWQLAALLAEGSVWVLPVALVCLVAARAYAVTTAAAIPRVVPESITLVKANSRFSIASLIGMALGSAVAGLVGRIGPDWSLRVAFLAYVVATILAITLPAVVDSHREPPREELAETAWIDDGSGDVEGEGPAYGNGLGDWEYEDPEAASAGEYPAYARAAEGDGPAYQEGVAGERAASAQRAGWRTRLRRRLTLIVPESVQTAMLAGSAARLLAGFLTLFAGFLMSEAPPEGVRDVVALGAVAVAAGVGNAGGAFVGNRLGQRAPLRVATGMLLLATLSAVATAAFYSLLTLVVLGLVTGAFAQLGRLCLGAIVQSDTDEAMHSRVFAQTETRLQGAWVVGGGLGTLLPLIPWLGFGVVSLVLVVALVAVVRADLRSR